MSEETKYIDLLQELKQPPSGDVDPFWLKNQGTVSNHILKGKLDQFLTDPEIRSYIFMDARGELLNNEVMIVERFFEAERLRSIIEDSGTAGAPIFPYKEYSTNHNNIHHLYHLARYIRILGEDNLKEVKSVLEWGGGYGNFCKIFLNAYGMTEDKTYTIIDLPEMCVLQKWFLDKTFPNLETNLLTSPGQKIKRGQINLVPSSFYELVEHEHVDLFVSTWGLSESPMSHHNFLKQKNWHGADRFLVALHQCGDHIPFMKESTHLAFMLKKMGCKLTDVVIIPGKNYYAFK